MPCVAVRIQPDAEELQALADTPSDRRSVLADPTRKDEGVESSEGGGQGSQGFLRLVAEERDRLGSTRVTLLAAQEIAHVRARLRDSEQPRP